MEKKTKILIISAAAVIVIAALAIGYFVFYAPNVKYKEAISVADNYFTDNKFEKAKSSYSNALEIKPKEEYPKQKIEEINRQLEAKRLQLKYDDAITKADKLYNEGNFENALKAYKSAAGFNPDEQYPKDKIVELNGIIENLRQKALEETYKYHVIVGAFVVPSNATRLNKKMINDGKSSRIFEINEGRMKAVSYSSHPTIKEAIKALPQAKEVILDEEDQPWVLVR